MIPRKTKGPGDGVSVPKKRGHAPLPVDTTRAKNKSSTPIVSDRTADMGGADKIQKHRVPYVYSL